MSTAIRGVAVAVGILGVFTVFLFSLCGTQGSAKTVTTTVTTATASTCEVKIHDDVVVLQNGKEMKVPSLALKMPVDNFILAEGQVSLTFTFSRSGNPATGEQTKLVTEKDQIHMVTDGFGKVTFDHVSLFLDGTTQRDNFFTLHYGGCETKFALKVGKPAPNGSVNPDGPVNTPDQMGVPPQPGQPHTVDFTVDPKFVAAFARFCGFSPEQATKVGLVQNDVQRFQVAWTGTDFVQARSTIEPGQFIWAVWFGDKECVVNPPCGNPTVPPNILPPAPPEEQLPPPGKGVPPVSTATLVSPPPPPVINTPVLPPATPVPPKEIPPTQVPPTATNTVPPPTATQTVQPRPKPCNCTPTDPDRPNVIPTPVNTIVYQPTPPTVQTTIPDPVRNNTPVGH